MITDVLSTIALAASERRPLSPALRELGQPLAVAVADRLDAGDTLPVALQGSLTPELADLLAGPRPDTASAALLISEWLRLQRADRLDALERLTHPLCGLLAIAAMVVVVANVGPAPNAGWLAAAAIVLSGAIAILIASSTAAAHRWPHIAALARHAQLASRYERAALVARWRLPEAQLAPLLGTDLPRLVAVLADPGAEDHCRQLAIYLRAASHRARRRLWWLIMALGYLAGGCLLLAAAVPVVSWWVTLMGGTLSEG